MNNKIHINPLLFRMIILVTCFILVMLYSKSYATTGVTLGGAKSVFKSQHNTEKHKLNNSLITNASTNGKYLITKKN